MRHAALILLLLLARPAAAQDIPSCNQDRVGAVACMAGKLCACGYQRGGSVSGRPDGYGWDCGILRPPCGEALAPAGSPGALQPQPQLFLEMQRNVPGMSPWLR